MAAMQSVALTSNQEAQFRVAALAVADDLASRMRANREYVNITRDEWAAMPADHVGYNVYSELDYNAAPPGALTEPTGDASLVCGDPQADVAQLNCRATRDVEDIRRQLQPTSGRQLPAGTLLFVDCADKPNLNYTTTDDTDACSPGSVYTIYVLWPTSPANIEAGQTVDDGAGTQVNRNFLNARCATRLATYAADSGTTQNARDYGCVLMDVVP